eukprot:scaffold131606_cov54-Attheya_sp.AAC.2
MSIIIPNVAATTPRMIRSCPSRKGTVSSYHHQDPDPTTNPITSIAIHGPFEIPDESLEDRATNTSIGGFDDDIMLYRDNSVPFDLSLSI